MNISPTIKRDRALTVIEVLVIVAGLMILGALLLPSFSREKSKAMRIRCNNNLKQVGLAYHVWSGDRKFLYPMEVPGTNGGTMEFITGPNAWRHYQVMSNELSTPLVLFCPSESDRTRFAATNFNINNSNTSFFVGVDASPANSTMLLSGDHNITNGAPVKNGILELTTNSPTGWTSQMHNKVGNIGLADGSVQQVSNSHLQNAIESTGLATNRLQMPVLTP